LFKLFDKPSAVGSAGIDVLYHTNLITCKRHLCAR